MILGGSLLGLSLITGGVTRPVNRVYTKFRIYGGVTIDKMQLYNEELTNTELQDMSISAPCEWTPTTLLMAEYENTLAAGNVLSLTETLTDWQITRQDVDENTLEVLDTVDDAVISYIDYTAQKDKTYVYNVFGLTANQISEPLQSAEITADFDGWFLIGEDSDGTTYAYHMNLDVNPDGNTHEEDYHEYETYTQFNAFSKGQRDFVRSHVSFLAGDILTDGELSQTVDYIKDLKDRLKDINPKILKNAKGEIMQVITHNVETTLLEKAIISQPYLVSFDFVECAPM